MGDKVYIRFTGCVLLSQTMSVAYNFSLTTYYPWGRGIPLMAYMGYYPWGGVPIMAYMGGSARKGYLFWALDIHVHALGQ